MSNVRLSSKTAGAVLRAAYRIARGKYLRPVSFEQIARHVDLEPEEFRRVAEGLEASGYSRKSEEPFSLSLEHAGLDWVELSGDEE